MNRVILLLIFLLASCVYTPDEQVFYTLKRNFVYREDIANEWERYESIDRRVVADCEGFAFTLQYQIGGEVWHVFLGPSKFKGANTFHHAVLLKDGIVYDNIFLHPTPKEEYPALLWLNTLDFEAKLNRRW